MNTKPIPAIVMLTAGLITSIMTIVYGMDGKASLLILLAVLVIFYILGGIVKLIIDKTITPELQKDEETAESDEENPEQEEIPENSEQ